MGFKLFGRGDVEVQVRRSEAVHVDEGGTYHIGEVALGMGALLQHKPDILTDRLYTRETDIKLNSGVMQVVANLCGLVVALKFIPEEYQLWVLPLIGVALSVAYLQIKLIPSIMAAQVFVITSALMAPLKMFVPQPEMWSTLFPVVVMLGMSHFLMASSELIKDEKHPKQECVQMILQKQLYMSLLNLMIF